MIDRELLQKYLDQFEQLGLVVDESEFRLIREPVDTLFYDHQNVFIKSYLVSACSMLEAFIQDLAHSYVVIIQNRINSANLPYNFIAWAMSHEKAKSVFKSFESNKTMKDISDLISPNYFKTMEAFSRVGINIGDSKAKNYKDFITATVTKRNKIVHHNDSASDLSFSDIRNTIKAFREYSECLFDGVCSSPHLQTP